MAFTDIDFAFCYFVLSFIGSFTVSFIASYAALHGGILLAAELTLIPKP